jgi:molybdopterin molybdotransferase
VLDPVTDNEDAVRDALRNIGRLDLLVTTGGVSVGDFDLVKDVLRAEGNIDLWSLRIKPGKPLAFGNLGDTPVIGLPGNPVAAAIAFLQFARPAIRAMLARPDVCLPEREVRVLDAIRNRGSRRLFARVMVERDGDAWTARLVGGQGSAMLTSLAAANALLVVPEEIDTVDPGMTLDAQMLDFELR